MTNIYYVAGVPFTSYNSLAHHGIKGQKWGVRRYQNPDGTYTEAGKQRYYKQKLPNDLDFSFVKDKKIKASEELKLLKMNDYVEDYDAHTEKEWDKYIRLENEIAKAFKAKKVEAITNRMYKLMNEHPLGINKRERELMSTWSQQQKWDNERAREEGMRKLQLERASALLKQIGYEDTQEARDRLVEMQRLNFRGM